MKTVAQFRRWLEEKILWAEGSQEFNESEHEEAQSLIGQAYEHAIELRLPKAAAAARKGPVRQRLVEVLATLADNIEPIALTPPQVAEALGVAHETVLHWIKTGFLKASDVATGQRLLAVHAGHIGTLPSAYAIDDGL